MKKILIFILALVLAGATLGLTACNNRDKDTIVIWAYDASVTAAQEAVKLYKKNNPNAKFEVVELAQDDLVQKFRIALASGRIGRTSCVFLRARDTAKSDKGASVKSGAGRKGGETVPADVF